MHQKRIKLSLLNKILWGMDTAHEFCVKKGSLMSDADCRCMTTEYCESNSSKILFNKKWR